MLRSLWFRLTGTVVALVIFTLTLSLVATLIIAGRQLSEFIDNTSNEIIQITGPAELLADRSDILDENSSAGRGLGQDEESQDRPNVTIDAGTGGRVEISPGGTIDLSQVDPELGQINVQIPEIVRSQSAQLARDVQNTILIAAAVSGTLAILVGVWLSWQITRPLARLRQAAEQFASGNLETRVPVNKKDEVGRVGVAFNHMAAQLQEQEGLRKQMVADIAHELRTPLTVMQANLEAMADELIPASPEELGGLHDEVLRLSGLVEDLRLLSLADAGELNLQNDLIDANDLVKNAVHRMAAQAEARGVNLTANIADRPLKLVGDQDKLHQVLANLIANSLRFTPAGKRVDVTARSNGQGILLQVADEGPGLDPAQLPHLFNRFYKGDRSRQRQDNGSGLGLSIVKQLVELHEGKIEATLPASGGLQMTIRLPAAGSDAS